MSARAFTFAVIALLASALGGCGLHPLYGSDENRGAAAEVFNTIYVDPIEGEIAGYELRNSLIDGLHSPMRFGDAQYRLKITITQLLQAIAVENNASITRYNYVLTGKYSLTDTKGKEIKGGSESTLSAYDVVTSPYATLAAEHDAQRRSAHELAYRIQTDLAVFLSHRTGQ
jgi:LPS-assembly lipoprotein